MSVVYLVAVRLVANSPADLVCEFPADEMHGHALRSLQSDRRDHRLACRNFPGFLRCKVSSPYHSRSSHLFSCSLEARPRAKRKKQGREGAGRIGDASRSRGGIGSDGRGPRGKWITKGWCRCPCQVCRVCVVRKDGCWASSSSSGDSPLHRGSALQQAGEMAVAVLEERSPSGGKNWIPEC